jgi:hypothetical protein
MSDASDVLYEADVLVVGGGSAGPLAAIAAARRGADVLLIESQAALGGSRTVMGVDTFYGFYSPGENTRRLIGGITYEVVERLMAAGAAFTRPNTFGAGTGVTYDMEQLKIVFEDMVMEAGARLLYHTFVPEVILEDGQLRGVMAANKAGLRPVLAKVIVDTTGDADIAARAGAPFELAGSGGLPVQSLSTIFFMGNVDTDRAFALTQAERTQIMKEAAESGRYKLTRIGGSIHPTPHPGFVHANLTRIPNIDATDPFALTEAEIEGRRQTQEYVRFLRDEHPGFEDAYLAMTASYIGVRETRRLIGEYVLAGEDVVSGRQFEDAVACCAAPIEDHHAGKDVRWRYVEGDGYYQIPYRSLLPKGVDDLIVAGRCLSATHEAQASARNSAQCMAMGEAAGVAATLALSGGIQPREVPSDDLRDALLEQGVVLDPIPVDIREL